MSAPQDILVAIATKLDQVTGLRVHSSDPGNVSALPAAICEIATLTSPASLGGTADYTVQVLLLVQKGDQRNSQERTLELVDPNGTLASSALVALRDYAPAGQIVFEGPRLLEYGGHQFLGGVFNVEVYG